MPKLSGIQEDLAWVDGRYLEVFRKRCWVGELGLIDSRGWCWCDALSCIHNSIVTKLGYCLILMMRKVSSEERLDGEYKKNLLFSKQVFIFGGS
jgi:hypothetical protein